MRRIIIIGASHHNTLSVVRCIGEAFGQIELVIVGCVKSFVSKSKYVKNVTFLKDADVFLKHDDILTTPLRPVDNFLKYFHKTIPANC